MHKEKIFNRIWKAAGIFLIMLAIAGCKGNEPAPAAETASEDMTVSMEMAETAQTAATAAAAEEEPALTLETALVGICLSDSEYGDNERLVPELERSLTSRGFMPENILVMDHTGSRGRQSKQVQECLDRGCSIVIVSPVSDKRIPDIADQISEAGASAIFLNCAPGQEELARWNESGISAVWIGTTYEQQLANQMAVLYEYSGTDKGLDFNEDGHVGALLIGGGEAAESALKETAKDLGSRLRVLGETESSNAEEISQYTQDILNEYRKEVEVILCSTEDRALAAADGVQLRHRLVGRDILVVGTSAHEETCEAIINKLMSGSTFTDFYEQASLTAVAAKDLIEGNLPEKMISNVVFKVTEENAQEVLDLLWKTRTALESRDAGATGETAAEAATEAGSTSETAAEAATEAGTTSETAAEAATEEAGTSEIAAEAAAEAASTSEITAEAATIAGSTSEIAAEAAAVEAGGTSETAAEAATIAGSTSEIAAEAATELNRLH